MRYSIKYHVGLIVQAGVIGLTLFTARTYGESAGSEASDKLRLSMESVTSFAVHPPPTFIRWNEHEYNLDQGIDVVMTVVRDAEQSGHVRELALIQLATLRTELQGRPCLDDLENLYDKAGELEKQIILTCFLGSRDIRGIRIFTRVLKDETAIKLRLTAATGLAGWNVRRGVAELVDLVDSKRIVPSPTRMPYVRDHALELFRKGNTRKGWGFPEEDIRKEIEGRTNVNEDQAAALYIAEIKTWFDANKDRFPDWQLGDPLPDVVSKATDDPVEK